MAMPQSEVIQLLVTFVEDVDKVWVNFVGSGYGVCIFQYFCH
jgi:glycopeptide antibiotics resistance protein